MSSSSSVRFASADESMAESHSAVGAVVGAACGAGCGCGCGCCCDCDCDANPEPGRCSGEPTEADESVGAGVVDGDGGPLLLPARCSVPVVVVFPGAAPRMGTGDATRGVAVAGMREVEPAPVAVTLANGCDGANAALVRVDVADVRSGAGRVAPVEEDDPMPGNADLPMPMPVGARNPPPPEASGAPRGVGPAGGALAPPDVFRSSDCERGRCWDPAVAEAEAAAAAAAATTAAAVVTAVAVELGDGGRMSGTGTGRVGRICVDETTTGLVPRLLCVMGGATMPTSNSNSELVREWSRRAPAVVWDGLVWVVVAVAVAVAATAEDSANPSSCSTKARNSRSRCVASFCGKCDVVCACPCEWECGCE